MSHLTNFEVVLVITSAICLNSLIKPHAEMCGVFLPVHRLRSLNELGRQTNSGIRICAGYNINHVIR